MYRCVKANESNEVLAIGMDEDQGGQDYHGIGTWCNFVFSAIPDVDPEVAAWAEANNYMGSLLKVVNDTIVSKAMGDFE